MAVLNGHEIGNHSLYHPCSGNFSWSRHKALEEYTLQKMMTELDSASKLIKGDMVRSTRGGDSLSGFLLTRLENGAMWSVLKTEMELRSANQLPLR